MDACSSNVYVTAFNTYVFVHSWKLAVAILSIAHGHVCHLLGKLADAMATIGALSRGLLVLYKPGVARALLLFNHVSCHDGRVCKFVRGKKVEGRTEFKVERKKKMKDANQHK